MTRFDAVILVAWLLAACSSAPPPHSPSESPPTRPPQPTEPSQPTHSLPTSQLIGEVTLDGRPVGGASITLDPGGATTTTKPDGSYVIETTSGDYKMTVVARGAKTDVVDVHVGGPGAVSLERVQLQP